MVGPGLRRRPSRLARHQGTGGRLGRHYGPAPQGDGSGIVEGRAAHTASASRFEHAAPGLARRRPQLLLDPDALVVCPPALAPPEPAGLHLPPLPRYPPLAHPPLLIL